MQMKISSKVIANKYQVLEFIEKKLDFCGKHAILMVSKKRV